MMMPGATPTIYELDLITAAWGWQQCEVAAALGTSADQLRALRNHEIPIDDVLSERIVLLRRIHAALWSLLAPGTYARWWRQPDTGFGGRAPVQVALEDELGLNRILIAFSRATW